MDLYKLKTTLTLRFVRDLFTRSDCHAANISGKKRIVHSFPKM